jgi:hypothetical protein
MNSLDLINVKTLSTITHYASIIPIMKYANNDILLYRYRNIIFLSSSASVIWHSYNEPLNILYYIDYSGAIIWFIFDLIFAYKSKDKIIITKFLILNMIILCSNLLIDKKSVNYNILHSVWHILSSLKCYYISQACIPRNTINKPIIV